MKKQLLHSRFAVRRGAPGKGFGLFAVSAIAKGDFILEYTGRHVPTREADDLKTKYLFEINSAWTVDGRARSNTARYINHACAPNAEAEIRDGRILIHALRSIKHGEEITIDYGEEYFDEFIKPHGCRCDMCVSHTLAPMSA